MGQFLVLHHDSSSRSSGLACPGGMEYRKNQRALILSALKNAMSSVQSVSKKEIPIQSSYSPIYRCSAFKRLSDLANSYVIIKLDSAHIL